MDKQLTIYAHRGDTTAKARENTAAAFDSALSRGFSAFELDLLRLKDGTIVVFHDFSLWRQFRRFTKINRLTLPEFRRICPDLITFDEFADRYASKDLTINLEVKDDPQTLEAIAPRIREFRRPVVSSFRSNVVDAAIDRGWTGGYLFEKTSDFEKMRERLKSRRVHISRSMLSTKNDVERFASYELHVYTVNETDEARRLAALPNVQGLFTDNPALLAAF
ncbi:MAG: hypothetical protein HY042_03920 [Spirochaetia bacterium]|nr:hypothetical protein [Spirochaetia bacterium]